MPCYTTTTTKVALGKVNLDRMAEAATAEGWEAQVTPGSLVLTKGPMRATFKAGVEEVELRGIAAPTAAVALFKRIYAARTVEEAARRHGWRVQSREVNSSDIKLKIGR